MLYTFEWFPTDSGPSGYNSVEAADLDEAIRRGNELWRSKYPGHVTLVVNPDRIWPDPDRAVLTRYNQAYAGMLD